MPRWFAISFLLGSAVLNAADFQDFQAARAVLGQPSFSAHEKSLSPVALSLSKGSLNVADSSGHLLSFDLARVGNAPTPGCPVCVTSPQTTTPQNVFEGISAFAVNGHDIAIVDTKAHRVMLWNGKSSSQPTVILSGFVNPVSVALDSQRLFVGDAGAHHVFIWNQLPTANSQSPDITLGVSDSYDVASADTIHTPSALVSDGTNLYVADSAAHRVLLFSASDSAAPQILNAAALTTGAVAPGTLVSIEHASGTVFLNGSPLRTTDSNGDQLQVQIPYEVDTNSSASLWLQNETGYTRAAALHFVPASPGIFAFGLKEPRTGLILHAPEGIPLSPENPAKPSELITAWATGLGVVSSDANTDGSFDVLTPVHASVNGNSAEVISSTLAADSTGVYEVRLRLPAGLSGSVSLTLTQNDTRSNAVTFPAVAN